MPIFEWKDSYLLGIQDFDQHHQHLVELLNEFYDDFVADSNSDKVINVLDKLIDYATYHISSEERWMKEVSYPELAEHANEHKWFTQRVVEIQKDFQNGRTNVSLEILSFLNGWLTNHILKTDADYARFAANQGKSKGVKIQLGQDPPNI